MFTGIITQKGVLDRRVELGSNARLRFRVNAEFLSDCSEGDSIAVSGVCLTAIELEKDRFSADVSVETLDKTTLGIWREGHEVNLEKSLRAADRLGGHMVSGHVDGRGRLLSDTEDGQSHLMQFEISAELARYVAVKGSISIDGISLTVNEVEDSGQSHSTFLVCIIPHTLQETTLGSLAVGDGVNLEVDMIARYLERLQAGRN
jgi:riboflavin synthase